MKQLKRNHTTLLLMLAIFVTSLHLSAVAQGTKFELNVPDVIVEGEDFRITFTINDDGRDFRMEPPQGLDILYGPQSSKGSSITIINGRRSSSKYTTYTYVLLAPQAGDYTIPAASIRVGNSTYRTQPRRIKVFSQSAVNGSHSGGATVPSNNSNNADSRSNRSSGQANLGRDAIFVTANVTKTNVYEQEGFLVTFKVYSQNDFEFENVKFPEFDGFLVQDVELPQNLQLHAEEYKGKLYRTVVIKQTYLFPQRSGKLTVPSGHFEFMVRIPVRRQMDSMDQIFDDFFGTTQTVHRTVQSPAQSITVKELPKPQPEGFNGAVGNYTLTSEAPVSVIKANESFKLKLTLKGNGNIKLTQLPKPNYPEGFESYDPTEEENITVHATGVSGTKTIEYYAVPRYPGDYTIPPIKFAYFDPTSGSYKELSTPQYKLHVDKGDPNAAPSSVQSFNNKQEVKYLGKDIRYIKKGERRTRRSTPNLTAFIVSYVALLLLATTIYFVLRAKMREQGDTVNYRRKRAGKMARRWLKLAADKRNAGDHASYYEALLNGITDYMSSKFHIPLSSMSKETIEQTLRTEGYDDEVIHDTLSLISDLELARYTPTAAAVTELDQLYDRSATLIERIESHKSSRK